ncbi:unnamed protein product [Wuchereria bancrofti]|uniref:Uncharacterized protein n=1 Tax=Wuchereria bancrofti TaxID=6293 RepID=A0A3P7E561_WUCBA|nr:unnamed protein product [Wuchereria bancrofti]
MTIVLTNSSGAVMHICVVELLLTNGSDTQSPLSRQSAK